MLTGGAPPLATSSCRIGHQLCLTDSRVHQARCNVSEALCAFNIQIVSLFWMGGSGSWSSAAARKVKSSYKVAKQVLDTSIGINACWQTEQWPWKSPRMDHSRLQQVSCKVSLLQAGRSTACQSWRCSYERKQLAWTWTPLHASLALPSLLLCKQYGEVALSKANTEDAAEWHVNQCPLLKHRTSERPLIRNKQSSSKQPHCFLQLKLLKDQLMNGILRKTVACSQPICLVSYRLAMQDWGSGT